MFEVQHGHFHGGLGRPEKDALAADGRADAFPSDRLRPLGGPRFYAPARIAMASGWLDPASSAAARRRTSSFGDPNDQDIGHHRFPAVSVPVLSKHATVISRSARATLSGTFVQAVARPR